MACQPLCWGFRRSAGGRAPTCGSTFDKILEHRDSPNDGERTDRRATRSSDRLGPHVYAGGAKGNSDDTDRHCWGRSSARSRPSQKPVATGRQHHRRHRHFSVDCGQVAGTFSGCAPSLPNVGLLFNPDILTSSSPYEAAVQAAAKFGVQVSKTPVRTRTELSERSRRSQQSPVRAYSPTARPSSSRTPGTQPAGGKLPIADNLSG